MRKLIVLASSLSQPRILRRICCLRDAGIPLVVYGYDRGLYSCNKLPSDIPLKTLGDVKNGAGYFSRFFRIFQDIRELIKADYHGKEVFYSFGFIESFVLWLMRKPYIYEMSDLAYANPRFGKFISIFKAIDICLVKRSKLTVMTSEGFLKFLFPRREICNVLVQPNKLNRCFLNEKRLFCPIEKDKGRTFAFVGAIRYPDTVLRFAKIIGSFYPNHRFVFWGEGDYSTFFKEQTKEFSNVVFRGRYRNPEDLKKIYSEVDIVVSCYGSSELNNRVAEPNKLYEAMFFAKPIIVSAGTFVAEQVGRYGCGYAINASDDACIRKFVDNLDVEEIIAIQERESALPIEDLIDDPGKIIFRVGEILRKS